MQVTMIQRNDKNLSRAWSLLFAGDRRTTDRARDVYIGPIILPGAIRFIFTFGPTDVPRARTLIISFGPNTRPRVSHVVVA